MPEPYAGELVELTACSTEFEAETIVQALRARGIPAVSGGGALAGQWVAVGKVYVQVMVRAGDLERAKLALRAAQAESVDIDWDEVDVGDNHGGKVQTERGDARGKRHRYRLVWRFGLFFIGFLLAFQALSWVLLRVVGVHWATGPATSMILFAAAFGFAAALALATTGNRAPRGGRADE